MASFGFSAADVARHAAHHGYQNPMDAGAVSTCSDQDNTALLISDRSVQNTEMPRGGSQKTPMWTKEEDKLLTSLYVELSAGRTTQPKIAETIGRSLAGCACRAHHLGLTGARGKHVRAPRKPVPKAPLQYATSEERRAAATSRAKEWHRTHPHPMAGLDVPASVREKIGAANRGRKVPPERILRSLQTRAKNGTLAPNHNSRTWKAGWREIGGKRIYARSRWEANYGRYLEWLKQYGQIVEWEHEPETFWFLKIQRGCRSYLPDFRVTIIGGQIEFHEVKGWMDARSLTKIKRMKKYHPKVVLRVFDAAWFKANRGKLCGLIGDWE